MHVESWKQRLAKQRDRGINHEEDHCRRVGEREMDVEEVGT